MSDAQPETFVVPPQAPTLFNATPESLLADTRRLIASAKAAEDAVIAKVTPETATFANTLLPLVQEENRRIYEEQLITFYRNAHPDPDLRRASEESETLFGQAATDSAMRKDLYALVAAVQAKHEALDAEDERLVTQMLMKFRKNGLGLSEADQARLREANAILRQLELAYLEACDNNTAGLWLDRDELAGLDKWILDDLKQGTGVHEGQFWLAVADHQWNVLGKATSHETRQRVYNSYAESCRGNVRLLEQAIALRVEKAHILGYSSFYGLGMADQMEKSPKVIQKFLDDLLAEIAPARDMYLEHWRRMKRDDLIAAGEPDDGKFYTWDRAYYSNRYLDSKVSIATDSIKEYFSVPETVRCMLRIFESVLGVLFTEVTDDDMLTLAAESEQPALRWADDIRIFAVWDDRDGRRAMQDFLGYLYLDLYYRPGKRSGYSCMPVRPAYSEPDGSRKYTSTALLCDFQKPTGTRPSLLEHNQVVITFHELGHGLHDLVAKTRYARFHGASCDDFNEVPSQMLEQWCFDPATLRGMSQHYSRLSPEYAKTWRDAQAASGGAQTEELPNRLPDDLFTAFTKSREYKFMNRTLNMLHMSMHYSALNTIESVESAKKVDSTEIFHETIRTVYNVDIADHKAPAQACQAFQFRSPDVYIYLVTQVYAMDIFQTGFAQNPTDRKQGLRYRNSILSKGSSEDPLKMLIEYLGRPPSSKAFHAALGLNGQSNSH